VNINKKGLDLIKKWEGLKLKAYRCPAGVYTIGYGTTEGVKEGDQITEFQAERMLMQAIRRIAERMNEVIKVPLNQNQFSALVCLIYNIGFSAFKESTLLKMLNIRKYEEASREFLRWCKISGEPSKGLMNRRTEEKELFITPSEH
jgi:lysozyme